MTRFYYGWVVVVGCFLCSFGYGLFYTFGVFFTSLEADFAWSAAATASILPFHHIGLFFSNFIIGPLTDKYGPRIPLLLGALLIGSCISLLSQAHYLYQFYIFFLIASLGSGVYWTLSTTIVQRWFIKNAGTPVGIVASGVGVGILFFSALSGYLITFYGWRAAFLYLGIISGLILLLCSFLIVTPEKKKITVPGSLPSPAKNTGPGIKKQLAFTEAIRTRTFSLIALCQIFTALPMFIIATHMVRYLEHFGIEKSTAANTWALVGAFSILGKFIIPIIAEKTIGWTRMLAVSALIAAASFIWLTLAQSMWMFYVFVIVYSLGYGGSVSLVPPTIRQHFGTKSLARLIGTGMSISTVGAIIGPVLAGYIFDASGSYTSAFLIGAGFWMLTALLAWLIKQPVNSGMDSGSGNRGAAIGS